MGEPSELIGPFVVGLFSMYLAQTGLAFIGWWRGEPMAADRGLWRIYWERPIFRDIAAVLRIALAALLVFLTHDPTRMAAWATFAIGVVVALFFRMPGDLPVLLLGRYGVGRPSSKSARNSHGGGGHVGRRRDTGREP